MFKKTNNSAQGRLNRQTEFSHKNTGDVDQSAFRRQHDPFGPDPSAERGRLVGAVQEIEERLALVNNRLLVTLPVHVFKEVEAERGRLLDELRDARHALRENKKARSAQAGWHKASHLESKVRFERAFVKMAKQMLAEEIFDRIFVAAQHRMDTDDE